MSIRFDLIWSSLTSSWFLEANTAICSIGSSEQQEECRYKYSGNSSEVGCRRVLKSVSKNYKRVFKQLCLVTLWQIIQNRPWTQLGAEANFFKDGFYTRGERVEHERIYKFLIADFLIVALFRIKVSFDPKSSVNKQSCVWRSPVKKQVNFVPSIVLVFF